MIAICGEYATGTIRATFAADPRRRVVLAAKTAVVGVVVLGAAAVAAVAAFYIGQAILHDNGYVVRERLPGGVARRRDDGAQGRGRRRLSGGRRC